jgi:hypothetical protein
MMGMFINSLCSVIGSDRARKAILNQAGRAFEVGKPMQNFASPEAKFCMSSGEPNSRGDKGKSSLRTMIPTRRGKDQGFGWPTDCARMIV